jgi:hypothetical protein
MGTALAMLECHVDPSQINIFKAAVDAQFGTDAHAILEPIVTPTLTNHTGTDCTHSARCSNRNRNSASY